MKFWISILQLIGGFFRTQKNTLKFSRTANFLKKKKIIFIFTRSILSYHLMGFASVFQVKPLSEIEYAVRCVYSCTVVHVCWTLFSVVVAVAIAVVADVAA